MPTIDFITYDEECLRDFKPVLAKEYLPEWWKNQKIHETNLGISGHTIQACPAMSDWLTIGWYIIANRDHKIMCGEEYGEDRDMQHHDMSSDASPSHPHSQFCLLHS